MGRTRGVVVQIDAADNTNRAFEAVNAQIAALKAQVATLQSGLRGAGDAAAHGVTDIQKVSAAIRTLDGNPGIRAIERFITQFPLLVNAASAAFNLIGAAGLLKLGVDLEQQFEAFREKALGAAAALREAYAEAHAHATVEIDDLAVGNAKLQERLDKLGHKPNNGLAVALAEAKKAADDLILTFETLQKEIKSVLEANAVGFTAQLVTGVSNTKQQEKELNADNKRLVAAARSANEDYQKALLTASSPADVQKLGERRAQQIRDLFDPAIRSMQAEGKRLQDEQAAAQKKFASSGLGYVGGGALASVASKDNSAKIANAQGEAQALADARDKELAKITQAGLQGKVASAEGKVKAPKNTGLSEAENTFRDAMRKADDAAAQSILTTQKLAGDLELAQLDDKHKRALISERDYYAQRLAIQQRGVDAELAANGSKQADLTSEIRDRIVSRKADAKDPAALTRDDAKILELQTQVVALEDKRKTLTEERAKLAIQGATEDYEATKKAADAALRLASQLESARGGSTSARLAELRSQYDDKRKGLAGASPQALSDLQAQQRIDEAHVGAQGAEQDASGSRASISARRSAIGYDQASGAITDNEAQRERVALDHEEAEALQPVLAAYKALAAAGDEGAKGKVVELSEQIRELENPVNEVAARVRGELSSAFEELFTNLDGGSKSLANFGKNLEKILLNEAYKQYLAPILSGAIGAVAPNGQGGGAAVTGQGSNPSLGGGLLSSLGGLIPGLAKVPGVSAKGAGGGYTVNIINQSSTPVQGSAAPGGGGGSMTDELRGPVTDIILQDLGSNGTVAQAFSGLSGMLFG